jgi:hypothetical protein
MDLKAYYKKIREVENTIIPPFVVIIGLDTPEGGKAGTSTEVTRFVAAKLISEGRARVASADETHLFYSVNAEARQEAEAKAAAQRMQVTIVGHTELKARPGKGSRE